MSEKEDHLKGRGAQLNPANKFDHWKYDEQIIKDEDRLLKTQFQTVFPKTIINKVDSPDIPLEYSLNPYQGCEHGCVYCYARPTHQYWGYSAGLDFEQKIMVKKNAPYLLEQKLKSKKWKPVPIMLSGNTDCYQPAEQQFEITRALLEIFWKYRHPVGIITKNALILRDLDLLKKLAGEQLLKVAISFTTLNEELRRLLEPRTSSGKKRLEVIQTLNQYQIPVMAMMAPIIPGLNSEEVFTLVQKAGEAGAWDAHFQIVRLNGEVATVFEDWIRKTYPDRSEKVLNQIRDCHGGQLSDSRFSTRMKGEGNIARSIGHQFEIAKRKFLSSRKMPTYNLDLHPQFKTGQLSLF